MNLHLFNTIHAWNKDKLPAGCSCLRMKFGMNFKFTRIEKQVYTLIYFLFWVRRKSHLGMHSKTDYQFMYYIIAAYGFHCFFLIKTTLIHLQYIVILMALNI